jgi:hypothetical protein
MIRGCSLGRCVNILEEHAASILYSEHGGIIFFRNVVYTQRHNPEVGG